MSDGNRPTEQIVVQGFVGLFDEDCEALLCNIRDRRWCWSHQWINASLNWERKLPAGHYSIDFRSKEEMAADGSVLRSAWGQGYGGIRFCRRCKLIDCIHYWEREITYIIQHSKYYETHKVVGHCRRCRRRIGRGSWGVCKPSAQAYDILQRAATELNRPPIGSGYGSGYMCELPVVISQVLDAQGEAAALAYAKSQFGHDGCRNAMDRVHR